MKLYNIQFQAQSKNYGTYSDSINHPRMLTKLGLLRIIKRKETERCVENYTTRIDSISHSIWSN